jgi:hypothetical protein
MMENYVKLLNRRDIIALKMDALNLDVQTQIARGDDASTALNQLAEQQVDLENVNAEINVFLFG